MSDVDYTVNDTFPLWQKLSKAFLTLFLFMDNELQLRKNKPL